MNNKLRGIKVGYRSGLEERVAEQLKSNAIQFSYEDKNSKISYIKPESSHKYTPDFPFGNIIIETKGRFTIEDRAKHLLIKKQHPELDIRFVFSNSRAKISKTSSTTYADWCIKNGFKYADKLIPKEWLEEIKNNK
jgi:hypothetical protein